MALFTKKNVPLTTPVSSGQTNNNYYGEIAKIMELASNTSRTNSGNITWTSPTSFQSYNTADSSWSSIQGINNNGETGLLNLLIYQYGNNPSATNSFLVTAENYNEIVNEFVNIKNGTTSVGNALNADVANKLGSSSVGNTSTPVYISSGIPVACSLASLNVGSATTATKANSANITTTANAVAYYTNTSGQFGSKASANGALYATSANGSLNWGTLPIAQGGTGATSRANARTNLGLGTMATASSSDYIANSLLSGAYDIIYSSAANTPARLPANTTTTKKFLTMTGNGSAGAAPTWGTLVAGDIPSLAASKITSGTLGVARGGTGARTFASGGLLVGNGTSAIGTVTKDSANTANAVVVRDASGNFSAGTITASLVGNVTGSATSATTATTATKLGSSDVGAANKLMYLQGGSPQAGLRIYSGTSAPQSGSGSDGDIYIQYSR